MTQIEEIMLTGREEIGMELASKLITSQEKTELLIERCPRCGSESTTNTP